jgi:transposase
MGYIQGEGRHQGTLFPVCLDELVPADHVCRVIDAFVSKLVMSQLGFERAESAEMMWLLGRLYLDHKSISEFRRIHRNAITSAGAELIRFARGCGLIRGEWIAIDGSKFRAVASVDSTRERLLYSAILKASRRLMRSNRHAMHVLAAPCRAMD